MREVVEIGRAMGSEQLLLALVYLAGYALALGSFASARGRRIAAAFALGAAAGFAALSNPWEAGVVWLGFASVGMGVFTATAWVLSAATKPSAPIAALTLPEPAQELAANLPRTRPSSSPRSVNTAPILNSPAAE